MILLAALLTPTAEASPIVSAEVLASSKQGAGIGARIGYPVDLMVARVVPEAGVTAWSSQTGVVGYGGARVAIGKLVEPGVYAHLLVPLGSGPVGIDAGGFVDVTALPKVSVGLNLGVIDLEGPAAFAAGVHGGLKF